MDIGRLMAQVSVCLLVASGGVGADQPLALQVSPTLTPAPGFVNVRAIVEASDDNRLLEIVAESTEYVRSSTIQLDGVSAPRVSVFEFRNLPPGRYDVSGFLIGAHGKRAAVTRMIQIVNSPGWNRR